MRPLLLICTCLSFLQAFSADAVKKSAPPDWISNISFQEDGVHLDVTDIYYLLVDEQVNLAEESIFRHIVAKVLNSQGIQTMSDITVEYDPSFQELTFHELRIIRDGQSTDRLTATDINVYQRETQLEKNIYDGSLTAVINLADVRKNDIIVYSYTVKGFNPLNHGQFSSMFFQEYEIPVRKIFNRIVTTPGKDIQIKQFNGAKDPEVLLADNRKEYLWTETEVESIKFEESTPTWYMPMKAVLFSTYKSWGEVVDWALPLYHYDLNEIKRNISVCNENGSPEADALCLVRLVQDDIRYLALESGMSGYKPHDPVRVFEQRYGDCKDKSLLLVALLNTRGIESYPLLVSTTFGHILNEMLPGSSAFNHCIVYFKINRQEYFVDPTISSQGGDLGHINLPNYEYGLLIKPDQNELISIPERHFSSIVASEIIRVESIGGDATYFVETEYRGEAADNYRQYFNSVSRDQIRKENLDFYSHVYPDIEAEPDFIYEDNLRNSENKIITQENYRLKNLWMTSDQVAPSYFEVYPLMLESYLYYPKTAGRTMPLYLGVPIFLSVHCIIYLPEEWPVTMPPFRARGEGFNYSNEVSSSGRAIESRQSYERISEYISPGSAGEFFKKHDEIMGQLSLLVTHSGNISGFRLSVAAVLLTIIALGMGTYFAVKLFNEYDPEPFSDGLPLNIGGWLVLPAIGLCVSPVIIIYQLVSGGYYNHNEWMSLVHIDPGHVLDILIIYGAEMFLAVLYLVYTVLVSVLFFKRRTSVPRLITFFYLVGLVIPLLWLVVYHTILPLEYVTESPGITGLDIFRAVLVAAIWIPYFNKSKRVRSTFCVRKISRPQGVADSINLNN